MLGQLAQERLPPGDPCARGEVESDTPKRGTSPSVKYTDCQR